jgi:hypothetical protein
MKIKVYRENKEGGEYRENKDYQGIFGERMTRVETDIKYIKESVSETNKKLDKFIDSADSKYAEKDVENRVLAVESEVKGINVTLAKYIGGVAVIFFILQLVLNYILK